MTYTTTRTITLPSSALWTQVEAAVREVGGTVGEAGAERVVYHCAECATPLQDATVRPRCDLGVPVP